VNNAHILLVDDDQSLLKLLSMRLEACGYRISCAESAEIALTLLDESVDLLLTDLRMEGMDGMALFARAQTRFPQLPVVIITAHGSIPEAVTATQQGVFGFLTKPIDRDQLLQTLQSALASTSRSEGAWRANIISRSDVMEQLMNEAEQIAGSDVSVLITGPSGSGKELMAQAIHNASPRRDKPFIAINCGALPEQLLESELFGHTKGAFTGAVNRHVACFRRLMGVPCFWTKSAICRNPYK
jgi:two-component system response regulator GlrR